MSFCFVNFERTERLWNNSIGSEIQFLKSKSDFDPGDLIIDSKSIPIASDFEMG